MIENATNEFVDDVVFEHAFADEFVEASLGFVQEDVIDVGNNRIVYCAVGLFYMDFRTKTKGKNECGSYLQEMDFSF